MLISIDGTFIIAAISFIIFMIIMKYILFKPLTTVIDQREKFYEKNSKTAVESKKKAQNVLAQKELELSQARTNASNLVKEISQFASRQREETLKQAKKEAGENIEKTKQELDEQSLNAKNELRNEISNFVNKIASLVLEKDVLLNLDEEKINNVINFKGSNNA